MWFIVAAWRRKKQMAVAAQPKLEPFWMSPMGHAISICMPFRYRLIDDSHFVEIIMNIIPNGRHSGQKSNRMRVDWNIADTWQQRSMHYRYLNHSKLQSKNDPLSRKIWKNSLHIRRANEIYTGRLNCSLPGNRIEWMFENMGLFVNRKRLKWRENIAWHCILTTR